MYCHHCEVSTGASKHDKPLDPFAKNLAEALCPFFLRVAFDNLTMAFCIQRSSSQTGAIYMFCNFKFKAD